MTSTDTIPTTLHDYQEYVRKEALKIQVDMGWPDEKLNATLRALGLPEKLTFLVPVEVTGRMFAVIRVDDAMTEEEARASIAGKTPDELRPLLHRTTQTGYFTGLQGTVVDMPAEFAVGDPDTTYANPSIAAADGHNSRYCEQYDSSDRHYCTRPRGHEGGHANGNGTTITGAWDA
jgi:hypothetical protein